MVRGESGEEACRGDRRGRRGRAFDENENFLQHLRFEGKMVGGKEEGQRREVAGLIRRKLKLMLKYFGILLNKRRSLVRG